MKNLAFLSGLFAFLSLNALEIPFNTSDFADLPQGRSTARAFVTNTQGEIVEVDATINPESGTLVLPTVQDSGSASVFIPDLGERYLFDNGHWVNRQGVYYANGVENTIPHENWSGRWNDYWSKDWPNHWNRYYDRHHNDSGFPYGDRRDWNNHWHDRRKYKHSDARRHRREHNRRHNPAGHHKGHHEHKHEHHHKSHHGGHHKK